MKRWKWVQSCFGNLRKFQLTPSSKLQWQTQLWKFSLDTLSPTFGCWWRWPWRRAKSCWLLVNQTRSRKKLMVEIVNFFALLAHHTTLTYCDASSVLSSQFSTITTASFLLLFMFSCQTCPPYAMLFAPRHCFFSSRFPPLSFPISPRSYYWFFFSFSFKFPCGAFGLCFYPLTAAQRTFFFFVFNEQQRRRKNVFRAWQEEEFTWKQIQAERVMKKILPFLQNWNQKFSVFLCDVYQHTQKSIESTPHHHPADKEQTNGRNHK